MILMEVVELYDIVIKVFSAYGLQGLVIGTIIVFLYFLLFKTNVFKKFFESAYEKTIGKLFTKKESHKVKESDLNNHDIFNYIDLWLFTKVNHIVLKTDFRTAVFKEYLTIYLRAYKTEIKNYLKTKMYENLNDSELFAHMIELSSKIVNSFEGEMYRIGIPNVVITKMGFERSEKVQITISLIENICFNDIYNSEKNMFKIYTIMDTILTILETTVNTIEPVCNSINGQLSGLQFRGFVEPSSH